MADVLIRGMEMPQRCKACRFCGFGGRRSELNVCMFTGESQPKLSQERMSKCPLVPLPAGHGRLIDADALASKYTEEINKLEEWAKIHEKEGRLEMFRTCHLRSAYLAEAKLNIEAAPTIVPAEGGNADA